MLDVNWVDPYLYRDDLMSLFGQGDIEIGDTCAFCPKQTMSMKASKHEYKIHINPIVL